MLFDLGSVNPSLPWFMRNTRLFSDAQVPVWRMGWACAFFEARLICLDPCTEAADLRVGESDMILIWRLEAGLGISWRDRSDEAARKETWPTGSRDPRLPFLAWWFSCIDNYWKKISIIIRSKRSMERCRGEGNVSSEKRDVTSQEAFAMLGALTWQATVIKMFVLCLREEIARGLFVFSPGFSVPCPVLLSVLHSQLRLPRTRSTIANLTWSYSASDKVQLLIHSCKNA